MHQVHHPEITVETADTATARWYLQDKVIVPAFQFMLEGAAFYSDRYVRTPDGWRVSHTGYRRTFEMTYNLADLPGTKVKTGVIAGRARRHVVPTAGRAGGSGLGPRHLHDLDTAVAGDQAAAARRSRQRLLVAEQRALVGAAGQQQARHRQIAQRLDHRLVERPRRTAGAPGNGDVQPDVAGLGEQRLQRLHR